MSLPLAVGFVVIRFHLARIDLVSARADVIAHRHSLINDVSDVICIYVLSPQNKTKSHAVSFILQAAACSATSARLVC